jgi:four helix bundle protein
LPVRATNGWFVKRFGDDRGIERRTFDTMQNYRRLSVWRKAHAVALNVHRLTERIPSGRNAGLVNQLRRAALSIPANIAEGSSRPTDKDFAKFLHIAFASTTEVEYHLEFAAAALIIPEHEFRHRQSELVEVRKMLSGLVRHLRQTDR